jgi:hypothetical protein
MTTRANKALLRRYKVGILNNRDIYALDQVAAPGYLDHAAFPGQAQGREGLKTAVMCSSIIHLVPGEYRDG